MKKGFSLVEIMQTVVLLGIIAGLSVSFFRKVNYDERLYIATDKMIKEAVQEVARQACIDDTPICDDGSVPTCVSPYIRNEATGNCEFSTAGDCPNNCISDPNSIHANTIEGVNFNVHTCICPPTCDTGGFAKPLSEDFCPNGVPDLSVRIGSPAYTLLCTKLHELINHRQQANTKAGDLMMTCGNNSVFGLVLSEDDLINRLNIDGNDNYDMLLPNGVRLYNLNGLYDSVNERSIDHVVIVVKYDRFADVSTAKYERIEGTDRYRSENIKLLQFSNDGTFIRSYPVIQN